MGLAENTPKSTSTCSEKPYVSHRPRESMKNGHFLMENSAARNDMSRQAMVDDPSGGEFEGSFGFRSFCCRHEKGLHSQWKPHRLIIILKTALNWSIDIPCWDRLADIMINWIYIYIYIYPNMPISIASLQIIIMTIMSWRSPIIFLVPSSFHPQSLCMISPVCLKVWLQTHSNDLYCAQKMTALFCFFFSDDMKRKDFSWVTPRASHDLQGHFCCALWAETLLRLCVAQPQCNPWPFWSRASRRGVALSETGEAQKCCLHVENAWEKWWSTLEFGVLG